jgi:hypothetical protein
MKISENNTINNELNFKHKACVWRVCD